MDYPSPAIALARWLRKRKRDMEEDLHPALAATARPRNPSTTLAILASVPKAHAFLAKRTSELRSELLHLESSNTEKYSSDVAEVRFALGLYTEASGGESALEEALKLVHTAIADVEALHDGCLPGHWRAEACRISKLLAASQLRSEVLHRHCTEVSSTSVKISQSDSSGSRSSSSSIQSVIDRRSDGYVQSPLEPTPPRPIPRVTEANLSCQSFAKLYARPGVPVIITGGAAIVASGRYNASMRSESNGKASAATSAKDGCSNSNNGDDSVSAGLSPWESFEGLATALRGVKAPLKVAFDESRCWAKLEDDGECDDIGAFIASVASCSDEIPGAFTPGKALPSDTASARLTSETTAAQSEPRYLHDWSLPRHAPPELAASLVIPKWFSGDLFPLLGVGGERLATAWPSLFVGPRGTKSDTHVDSGGSHFWMALLHGEKRWRIFPREDAGLLYPAAFEGSRDWVFTADATQPDPIKHPAACLTRPWEGVLRAGDLLFVPNDCPHQVLNLSNTMAISANFVDSTNGARAVEALREEGLNDSAAASNAQALQEALVRGSCTQQANGSTRGDIADESSGRAAALVHTGFMSESLDDDRSEHKHVSYLTIAALAASLASSSKNDSRNGLMGNHSNFGARNAQHKAL